MNETNSPLPPPSGETCPNCGAEQNVETPYCTNCGAELKPRAPGLVSKKTATILSVVLTICGLLLTFAAIALGAIGGCFALLGGSPGGSGLAFLIGGLVVGATACVAAIIFIQKKKR